MLVLELGGDRPALSSQLERVARMLPSRTVDAARGSSIRPPLDRMLPARQMTRVVLLREGESLSELASRVLGSARRWPEIAQLNGIEDETRLSPGARLRVPSAPPTPR